MFQVIMKFSVKFEDPFQKFREYLIRKFKDDLSMTCYAIKLNLAHAILLDFFLINI